MVLLAMNWKAATPPDDFVGFAVEVQPPGQAKFFPLKNRINFRKADGSVDMAPNSTLQAPLQKFRWVHFPHDVNVAGQFNYRVHPVFMDNQNTLTLGDPQQVAIDLTPGTFPGELTVAFTRGFVSSQAFVDQFCPDGNVGSLIPGSADSGPDFIPTNPKAGEALAWMGFESRQQILGLLDAAIADATCAVRVVAYDLNERNIIERLKTLGPRLRIIIDNGFLQLFHGGRHQERGKPFVDQRPPNSRRLHDRSVAHLRSLPLPRGTERSVERQRCYRPTDSSPQARRPAVVEALLHRSPQDQGSYSICMSELPNQETMVTNYGRMKGRQVEGKFLPIWKQSAVNGDGALITGGSRAGNSGGHCRPLGWPSTTGWRRIFEGFHHALQAKLRRNAIASARLGKVASIFAPVLNRT
jgi:hypothetical protein